MASQKLPDKTVFFDGVCNLCTGAVQFILKNNSNKDIYFASLQSTAGQSFLKAHGLSPHHFHSIVFVENGRLYDRSSAALQLAKHLDRPWKWLRFFRFVPKVLRDALYQFIAKNRYRWFGKKESCWLPAPELTQRFLN